MQAASPRLAVLALSAGSEPHAEFRCYQRASVRALGAKPSATGSWMPVLDTITGEVLGSILSRFVVPPSRGASREHAVHKDLLILEQVKEDGLATCAARVLLGFRSLVALHPELDFLMVTDDDVWYSPPRLLHDFRELLPTSRERHIVYGTLSFAAGWSETRLTHFGFSAHSDIESRLPLFLTQVARRRSRGEKVRGPFPFLMGYFGAFSQLLAREMAASPALDTLASTLLATTRTRRPDRYVRRGKCFPGGDVSLGIVLQSLQTSLPFAALDTTYANRALPFYDRSSGPIELTRRAAMLHNATRWEDHFRRALCLSAGRSVTTTTTTTTTRAGRPRPDVAPVMRCRGPAAPTMSCGKLRCTSRLGRHLHNGSNCVREARCRSYFESQFANWTFCIAVGYGKAVRRSSLVSPAICNATRAGVLRECRGAASDGAGRRSGMTLSQSVS